MKRLLRYRLSLLLILISLSVSGQTPNSTNNSALIAAAIKEFDDPRGVDPMKTYTIINDLKNIKNSCDANQKNTIDLLTSEQQNRQGDITGFIEGMSELINRQPQFKEQLLIHYFAINTTKYWIHKNNLINASNSSLKNIFEARRSKVNRNISQAYQNRAFLFRVKNMKDSAVFYSILSTKYAKRSDSRIDLALSFHNESLIQAHFGELELAVEKELLALQIAEKLNLIYLESMFNRMICNYSLEVLNIKESYVYLKKAKSLATKLNDERSIALCEISESGILIRDFKYNDAITLLEKAIKKL